MTSLGALAVDAVSAVLVLIGVFLFFRARKASLRARDDAGSDGPGLASVLLMIGVMMVAFGVVICVFANLIVYYTAHPPT